MGRQALREPVGRGLLVVLRARESRVSQKGGKRCLAVVSVCLVWGLASVKKVMVGVGDYCPKGWGRRQAVHRRHPANEGQPQPAFLTGF